MKIVGGSTKEAGYGVKSTRDVAQLEAAQVS